MSATDETKDLVPAAPTPPDSYDSQVSFFKALPAEHPFNEMLTFTNMIKNAKFLPQEVKGDVASILFLLQTGRDMGLNFSQSVRHLYMTQDGRLGMEGAAILSLLQARGFKCTWPTHTNETATSKIVRPDGEVFEFTFGREDAERIKFGKADSQRTLMSKFNYRNNPQNMFMWRSFTNNARFAAADVAGGLYSKDEMEDFSDSTTGDATESDRQRMEQLQATEDKYKVKLKEQPQENKQENKPVVVDVKSEPVKAAPAEITYEIYRMFPTGNGVLQPLPCDGEEPQKDKTAAGLRAQALANGSGMEHRVVKVEKGERSDAMRAYPPEKKAPEPATAAPVAEPAKPAADKPVEKTADKPADKPKEVSPAIARLNALATQLGIPGKTASTRFVAFMSGFAGCSTKEWRDQPEAAKMAALEELEAICAHDANEFNSGPEEAGKRRRQWANATREYLTNLWKDATAVDLGCKLARQWGLSPDHWQKWVSSEAIELDFKPLEDVRAILRVLLRTRQAANLIKLAKTHGLALAEVVDQIDKRALDGATIDTASAAAVEAGVARFISDYNDYLRKQAQPVKAEEPAAKPSTEKAEDAATDNLFGDQQW